MQQQPKEKRVKPSVRMRRADHDEIVRRADAAGLTLNDYLIECALNDERRPDKETRALRERAVFELYGARLELQRLVNVMAEAEADGSLLKYFDRKVVDALGSVEAAARLMAITYLRTIPAGQPVLVPPADSLPLFNFSQPEEGAHAKRHEPDPTGDRDAVAHAGIPPDRTADGPHPRNP